MNWAEVNAHADINRDRRFRVMLRPGPDVDLAQVVDVEVAPAAMREMAAHGPLAPVLKSFVINLAQTRSWRGMAWYDDPIVELH